MFKLQATEQGVDKETASTLLSIIGIANALGRIVLGYVADMAWINRLLIYNFCLTICGLGIHLICFLFNIIILIELNIFIISIWIFFSYSG